MRPRIFRISGLAVREFRGSGNEAVISRWNLTRGEEMVERRWGVH